MRYVWITFGASVTVIWWNVADSLEEAEAFLEDCMAVICDSIKEVKQFLDESGADVSGMSNHEIEEAEEVFSLPDGRYLVVEA